MCDIWQADTIDLTLNTDIYRNILIVVTLGRVNFKGACWIFVEVEKYVEHLIIWMVKHYLKNKSCKAKENFKNDLDKSIQFRISEIVSNVLISKKNKC